MGNDIQVKPLTARLQNLLEDVANGELQIPIFQREFIWKNEQMLSLFDSISKGYPIGSLLLWKPTNQFEVKKKIGPYNIPQTYPNFSYVLDGFQRITTLYSALTNPHKQAPKIPISEFSKYIIYFDLRTKEFIKYKNSNIPDYFIVELYKIMDTFEFIDILNKISKSPESEESRTELIENAKQLSKVFYDYEIPYIEIKGGDISSAVEIFSRTNSTGVDISKDYMLSALTYNSETNFLLSDAISTFINKLKIYNFDTLKRDTILNCIFNSTGKMYFDVKIDDLRNSDIQKVSESSFEHIEKAVKFMYNELSIYDTRLIPYPTQLIFFSEFFRLNKVTNEIKLQRLKDWFWITSYSNYFTIYSLSHQKNAYSVFIDFVNGNHPNGIYKINRLFSLTKSPEKINYFGVRSKILQLYMLNSVTETNNISINESISDFYVFSSKDRRVGNVILRRTSEFMKSSCKLINDFINNTDMKILNQYYIDQLAIKHFNNNQQEEFIKHREKLIRDSELKFIQSFNQFESLNFSDFTELT